MGATMLNLHQHLLVPIGRLRRVDVVVWTLVETPNGVFEAILANDERLVLSADVSAKNIHWLDGVILEFVDCISVRLWSVIAQKSLVYAQRDRRLEWRLNGYQSQMR